MFSTNGSEKDPVAVYKFSVQERPEKMKDPDAPFQGDIAVNIQIFEFWKVLVQMQRGRHQQTRGSYERNVKESGSSER